MRYWLGRLPFTFLILGVWLGYEGYRASKGLNGPVSPVRVGTYFVAAVMSLSMAMMAFRERYRPKG